MAPKPKHDEAWQANLEELKKFKKENDHFKVPLKFVSENVTDLGQWVNSQRHLYKQGKLSQNRIDALNAIDFCWDPLEEEWQANLEEVKRFKKKNNHARIPRNYTTESGGKLGQWVNNQRKLYKKKEMPQDRMEKLTSLGFVWEAARGSPRHADSSRSSAQATSGADRKRAAENPELSYPNPKRAMQGDIPDQEMDKAEQGMVIANLEKDLDGKDQTIAGQKTHPDHKDKTIADQKADLESKERHMADLRELREVIASLVQPEQGMVITNLEKDLDCQDETNADQKTHHDHKDKTIAAQKADLASKDSIIADLKRALAQRDKIIANQKHTLNRNERTIADQKTVVGNKDKTIAGQKTQLDRKDKDIANLVKTTWEQLDEIKSKGRTVSDQKQDLKHKDEIIKKQKGNLHRRIQKAEKRLDELFKCRNGDFGLHKDRHVADLRELREEIASLVKH